MMIQMKLRMHLNVEKDTGSKSGADRNLINQRKKAKIFLKRSSLFSSLPALLLALFFLFRPVEFVEHFHECPLFDPRHVAP